LINLGTNKDRAYYRAVNHGDIYVNTVKPSAATGLCLSLVVIFSNLHAETTNAEEANTTVTFSNPPPLPPIPTEFSPMNTVKSLQSAFKKMDTNHDERISFNE